MRFHSINLLKRKQLGVFYTPHHTAESLAAWAIRTGHERILEPSVGGGALLTAALARAKEVSGIENSLAGTAYDIDPQTISILKRTMPKHITLTNGDFLEVPVVPKAARFDVVLANPPFTRNHSISTLRREQLRKRFRIKGAAGLWVHFLLHASRFLSLGGRMVSIVPRSALFTDYGDELLQRLSASFAMVKTAEIPERPQWIGAADERGAIVFAEGYGERTDRPPTKSTPVALRTSNHETLAAGTCYNDLTSLAVPFSSLFNIRIGAVTGCNKAFLLTEDERIRANISREEVYPVISRANQTPGLRIDRRGLESLAKAGHKTWLISPHDADRTELSEALERHLSMISDEQRISVSWLRRRTPWWRVERGPDCDAIFTYMNDSGPRLVRLGPGIVCTNTLHRLTFPKGITRQQIDIASVSLISTFGQLAGELHGRSYGGGVLKFEISETRAFPVLTNRIDIDGALRKCHSLLIKGLKDEARRTADEALLRPLLGSAWLRGIEEMEEVLRERRRQRGHNPSRSRT